MSHLLVYDFMEHDLANVLIVVKPSTKSLVFVSLSGTKPKLLGDAKKFVSKVNSLSKNKGSIYTLKNKSILKSDDVAWLEQLSFDFLQILAGGSDSQTNIKCEYLLGTEFQKKVWETTKTIKAGATISYQQLAVLLGNPKAVRAIGSALAKNNIAVVIPCHRIIGSKGKLTGFRWGIELKESLLRQEQAI